MPQDLVDLSFDIEDLSPAQEAVTEDPAPTERSQTWLDSSGRLLRTTGVEVEVAFTLQLTDTASEVPGPPQSPHPRQIEELTETAIPEDPFQYNKNHCGISMWKM